MSKNQIKPPVEWTAQEEAAAVERLIAEGWAECWINQKAIDLVVRQRRAERRARMSKKAIAV
jgi:hypothetical protein